MLMKKYLYYLKWKKIWTAIDLKKNSPLVIQNEAVLHLIFDYNILNVCYSWAKIAMQS